MNPFIIGALLLAPIVVDPDHAPELYLIWYSKLAVNARDFPALSPIATTRLKPSGY